MFKSSFLFVLFCMFMLKGSAQAVATQNSYPVPSQDKLSWQWLNLMTSATYYRVVKEGELDFNSCLLQASQSLGMSRTTVLAEGIKDPELLRQAGWINQRVPAVGIRQLSQLKGKRRLHQLLLLGSYYAFQPLHAYRTDSASYFLQSAIRECEIQKETKLKTGALCLLGKVYFEVNEVQRGDSLFSRLLQECGESQDKEGEARGLFYWAMYPNYNPATTAARIERFQKAAALYHELKNQEAELNALMDAGYLLVTTFELAKAQESFMKALAIAEAIRFPYTHYYTDALAMVTTFQGKFGEPLKYTLQTIRTAEKTRDSIGWAYFYSRLGGLYTIEGGRDEESLKWRMKALERFVQAGDPGLSITLHNIAGTLVELNRGKEALGLVTRVANKIQPQQPRDQIYYNLAFARAYQGQMQYQLAERYAIEAVRIQKQFPFVRGAYHRSFTNLLLGEVYFSAKRYERSKKYLEAYLFDPFRDQNFTFERSAYSQLIKIDSVLGDATVALNRYKRYTRLLDSNFQISKIRQAEELQVMYETEEKEAQITLLNQRAKLEQANLRQATLLRNVTIAGIAIVLVIAVLLFRQSRHRQHTNKVITHKNEQLEHLLTEKEWLLKEIHHRVKNNLQIVMSLLNSQSAYIDNPYALTAIHDSQHRVHAMSLIHQKLYGSDNVSTIDMPVYIREMITYLADSFAIGQRIRFESNIEPLELDVGQAVPLGLILNEAITNAIKYAFPDRNSGVIDISLTHTEDHQYKLSISDNGIGMPTQEVRKKTGSLGMSLMEGLSEDLEGSLKIESGKGTKIVLSFAAENVVRRTTTLASSFASAN